MPRTKTPPPTSGTLHAVVRHLAEQNAILKESLKDAEDDLRETLDRTLENQRRDKKERDRYDQQVSLLMKEIDGKGDQGLDWYIQKVRMMRTQLKRLRAEQALIEQQVEAAQGEQKTVATAGKDGTKAKAQVNGA